MPSGIDLPPDVEGIARARSASKAFLYRRLQTLPEAAGLFRLNAPLAIPFDGWGAMEVDLLWAEGRVAIELDGAAPTARRPIAATAARTSCCRKTATSSAIPRRRTGQAPRRGARRNPATRFRSGGALARIIHGRVGEARKSLPCGALREPVQNRVKRNQGFGSVRNPPFSRRFAPRTAPRTLQSMNNPG